MTDKKTILVTGGAGFIGSNTAAMLCDQGHSVRIIDDLSFGFKEFVDHRVQFYQASIADDKVLDKALAGVDVVMHFAASSIIKFSLDNPISYVENNILNGVKLLESMRRAGVKKIIFSSSASVYGEPIEIPIKEDHPTKPMQPYGASKLSFETILGAYHYSYGIASVSLRYFNAYGPNDEQRPATRAVPMWIKEILNGQSVKTYWQASQIRDYVFVKDIAEAHASVLNLEGCHIFNIGSGSGVVMKDIIKEIMLIVGTQTPILDQGERPGDPTRLVADISAINKAVGWKPRIGLHDGLIETIAYYKKHIGK